MAIYVVLGFSLQHLVADCLAAVASEARPGFMSTFTGPVKGVWWSWVCLYV